MMLLLVLHYGRERAPQPFLLERVRNRGLVPNAQLFHWAPPFSHCAERARERRKDLAPHLPLQLLHLCVDYQVNRFVGCDCHIEQGFKITKRGGWQWQRTRMGDPQRAARLWLAVAVATLWLLSVGGAAEETIPKGTLLPLPTDGVLVARPRQATQLRLVSVFRQGWMTILVALFNQRCLPLGRFVPEPWPQAVQGHSLRGNFELLLAA
jgi:hypothetical protein